MSKNIQQNLSTYNNSANALAQSYNAVSAQDVLGHFTQALLDYPNKTDLWVLDIGCGTGRDTAWIAEQGFKVIGVDGSDAMLEQAKTSKNHPNIQYIVDSAPDLAKVKNLNRRFDIILMNAFLFHLDENQRKIFYQTLKNISQKNAYFFITLRQGPVPEGRVMYDVPLTELQAFAGQIGARLNNLGRKADPLGRTDVSWDHIELELEK